MNHDLTNEGVIKKLAETAAGRQKHVNKNA
jgi:hypothetical protein